MRQRLATPKFSSRRGFSSRRKGQAILETGVVILLLLMLSFGVLQYGMVYNAGLTLNNMAREGARYAAVRSKGVSETDLQNKVIQYLKGRAAGTSIDPNVLDAANVKVERPKDAADQPIDAVGTPIRVRIFYDMEKNKSFLPSMLPLPARWKNYQASAANLVEGPPVDDPPPA